MKVRLFRLSYDWEEEALKLSISFPLDNDRFAEVVAGFRKLFNEGEGVPLTSPVPKRRQAAALQMRDLSGQLRVITRALKS